MTLSSDIDEIFLNSEEFAITALYEDVDLRSVAINGIFDDPYAESIPETTIGVESQGPTFKCKLADITSNFGETRNGDKLIICSKIYDIIESEPDGVGLTVLILHERAL